MGCPDSNYFAKTIVRFIKGTPIPVTLTEHLDECPKCSGFFMFAMKQLQEQKFKTEEEVFNFLSYALTVINTKQPTTVLFGQLWICPALKPTGIVFISRTQLEIPDISEVFVGVVPLNVNFSKEHVGTDDVFIEESETSLKKHFLVEMWNERPILRKDLSLYIGEAPERIKTIADERFTGKLEDIEVNPKVSPCAAFRAGRIIQCTYASYSFFQNAPFFGDVN